MILVLLGGYLLYKISPKESVESIGYQYAVREDISKLSNLAIPEGYTSLNTQSFFAGRTRVQKLAQWVVEGKTTDLEKAQALVNWVQLHVRPQTSAPTTVITDDYVNVIKRGWGYCDQMAHVFATMATYVGLEAEQLQLYRDDGVSPHTLAMVKIDGQWVIASTWRGVIPINAQGHPYTLPAFIELLKKHDIYSFAESGIGATEFENAKVLKTYPYLSNISVTHKILNRVVDHVKALTSSTSSTSSTLASDVLIPSKELTLYNKARDADLDLNFITAISIYGEVISTSNSSILKNEARFQLGMAYFDTKNYQKALITFTKIIASQQNSAWEISAKRMEAETLLRLGQTKQALAILDSVHTIQSDVRAYEIRNNPTALKAVS